MIMRARPGRRLGHNDAAPLRMRRKDTVVADERVPRWRYQRGKPREELHQRHYPMGAAPSGVLDSICHAAAGKDAEPFEREAGPGAVTYQPLSAFVLIGLDAHCGLHIEPIDLRRHWPATLRLEACLPGVPGLGGIRMPDPGEGAATERDGSARFERARLRRLVGSLLGQALLEEPFLPKPAQGAVTHAVDNPLERFARGCERLVEAHPPSVVGYKDVSDRVVGSSRTPEPDAVGRLSSASRRSPRSGPMPPLDQRLLPVAHAFADLLLADLVKYPPRPT